MLIGCEVADVPVIVASIDPCLSCANRVTLVDYKTGEVKVVNTDELRRKKL
jgi:membrane-bound hydrogenase subunit alpha